MRISRIERNIGPKINGHVQRVTYNSNDGKLIQIGETLEHGHVTFRETIEKGFNYFKRSFESFRKDGSPIEGSKFTEEVIGEEANSKKIRNFGVIG